MNLVFKLDQDISDQYSKKDNCEGFTIGHGAYGIFRDDVQDSFGYCMLPAMFAAGPAFARFIPTPGWMMEGMAKEMISAMADTSM